MRIGVSGRIGTGIALFAAVADAATWLVRAFDNYPFGFYDLSDAYLPFIFLFGLALVLPSLSIYLQTKRAANLANFPLTTVGPVLPELLQEAGQIESCEGAIGGARWRTTRASDEIPPPNLIFVPSPSHRKLFQRLGRVFVLLAVLSVPLHLTSRDWELPFYLLVAVAFLLLLWPDVRETEELSLQGETRAAYKGMARVDRTFRPLIRVMKPLPIMRIWSYMWLMVLVILWMIFSILTPRTPRGLMVHLPRPETFARADEPWNEPLVVRVDAEGNLYLNRQPLPPSALERRLQETLKLRADWRVFVDGDPNAAVGAVVWVVDTLHGRGIRKVLLVTPSMKKEKPASFEPPPV